MPGDPKECRVHAAHCRTLAAEATGPAAKKAFTDLAEHWDQLAAELESAQAFLAAMNVMDTKRSSDPSASADRKP